MVNVFFLKLAACRTEQFILFSKGNIGWFCLPFFSCIKILYIIQFYRIFLAFLSSSYSFFSSSSFFFFFFLFFSLINLMPGRSKYYFKGLVQEDIGAQPEKKASSFSSWVKEPVCDLLAGCNPFSLLLPHLLNEFHVLFPPSCLHVSLSSPMAIILWC